MSSKNSNFKKLCAKKRVEVTPMTKATNFLSNKPKG